MNLSILPKYLYVVLVGVYQGRELAVASEYRLLSSSGQLGAQTVDIDTQNGKHLQTPFSGQWDRILLLRMTVIGGDQTMD